MEKQFLPLPCSSVKKCAGFCMRRSLTMTPVSSCDDTSIPVTSLETTSEIVPLWPVMSLMGVMRRPSYSLRTSAEVEKHIQSPCRHRVPSFTKVPASSDVCAWCVGLAITFLGF